MKVAGAGRILLWTGGSLWIGRSGAPTELHAHHAVQIALALAPGGLRFRSATGDWNTYAATLIAANHPHAFDGGGNQVATIFVEPESRAGQVLQQRCRADGIIALGSGTLDDEPAALFDAYDKAAPDSVLVRAACAVTSRLTATPTVPRPALDPRIQRTLERIRASIGEPLLLTDLAAAACLSPDRFRHLFLEQTGIRFRPYVLWLRIEVALAAYAAHRTLTDAAHAGGFADSAHFSRTFKSMFGIAPSSIQID
jgi:transcriptional regulator GlxA family with amidase domain